MADLAAFKSVMNQIKKMYGDWQNKEVPPALLQFLLDEIHIERIDDFYKALLRSHPVSWGAPDIAACDLAIKRAKERGEYLDRPVHVMNWSSSPVLEAPPTEDERGNQLTWKAQAAAVGINVEADGWMASFIMHEVERKARENGRMALPGDKRAR